MLAFTGNNHHSSATSMHPENLADELDRIARILTVEGSGNVEPLPAEERAEYRKRLDKLLHIDTTRVVVLLITQETRQYLYGYTEGAPEHKNVHVLLTTMII